MNERQQLIVTEALSWVGTPYHYRADVKGEKGGVDCSMLLVRTYVDTGCVPAFDPRTDDDGGYPPVNFFLHVDDPRFMGWIRKFGFQVETPEPADVAVFRFGKSICHGAIMVADDRMVHAHQLARRVEVTEIKNAPMFADRLAGYWRIA